LDLLLLPAPRSLFPLFFPPSPRERKGKEIGGDVAPSLAFFENSVGRSGGQLGLAALSSLLGSIAFAGGCDARLAVLRLATRASKIMSPFHVLHTTTPTSFSC
jgi:hypothetical protein